MVTAVHLCSASAEEFCRFHLLYIGKSWKTRHKVDAKKVFQLSGKVKARFVFKSTYFVNI